MLGRSRVTPIAVLICGLLTLSPRILQAQVSLPIAALNPADGETVIGRRPAVRVTVGPEAPPLTPGQVLLTIDGLDVTSQLTLEDHVVRLKPVSDLAPGAHSAVFTITDSFGQPLGSIEWSFTVRDWKALEEGSLEAELSEALEVAMDKSRGDDPRWKSQGNVRLGSRILERDFESTLNGNIHVIDQAGPGTGGPTPHVADLTDWLFMTRYRQQKIEVGDLQLSEGFFLTGESYARRGVRASAELFGVELHLFGVQTQPTIGFRDAAGVSHPDRRIHGVSLARAILPDNALRVKATFLEGDERQPSSFHIGSSEGGKRGSAYSFIMSSSLLEGMLRGEAEGAVSRFDPDIADPFRRRDDHAWRVKAGGSAWKVDLDGEYSRVGRSFGSLANPTLVPDREGFKAWGSSAMQPFSLNANFSQFHDNISDDRVIPRITQRLFAATFGLTTTDYPALMFTYQRSEQNSSREPAGLPPFKVATDTFSGSLSYSRPTWTMSIVPSYSIQDTREGTNPDTETLNVTWGVSLNPDPSLSVGPSFGFTKVSDRTSDVSTDTFLATLTGRWTIIADLLTFDTQGSYTRSTADDGSTDQWNVNGLARLSLSLERFLFNHGKQTLSIRANYNRTLDRVNPTNSVAEVGVFAVLDLAIPVPILPLRR